MKGKSDGLEPAKKSRVEVREDPGAATLPTSRQKDDGSTELMWLLKNNGAMKRQKLKWERKSFRKKRRILEIGRHRKREWCYQRD